MINSEFTVLSGKLKGRNAGVITAVFSFLFHMQVRYFFMNKLHIAGLKVIPKRFESPNNFIGLTSMNFFQPKIFINTMLQSRSVKKGGTIGVEKARMRQHQDGFAKLTRVSKVPWYAMTFEIATTVRMRMNAQLVHSP